MSLSDLLPIIPVKSMVVLAELGLVMSMIALKSLMAMSLWHHPRG
jgi:hypothetical protein